MLRVYLPSREEYNYRSEFHWVVNSVMRVEISSTRPDGRIFLEICGKSRKLDLGLRDGEACFEISNYVQRIPFHYAIPVNLRILVTGNKIAEHN